MEISNQKNTYFTLFLILVLAGGLFLRLWNIGEPGFWTDEYWQVFAAQSLVEEGTPYVPLRGDYRRSFLSTLMIVPFFKYFGVNEMSARLPSAFTSFLFLILGFFTVRKLINTRVALIFVTVMSFSPFVIKWSRECRFYALFQFIYFFMSYYFLVGFESTKKHGKKLFGRIQSKYQIDFRDLFFFLILLGASLKTHFLTVNFAFVVISYCFLMFLSQMLKEGFLSAIRSKYSLLLTLFFISYLIVAIFWPGILKKLVHAATFVPAIYNVVATNYSYYRYFLTDNYPVLFFLFPISMYFFIKDKPKKGCFILCSFLVVFLLHSFVFGRKAFRYIYYVFPFFVLGASYFLDVILSSIGGYLKKDVSLSRPRHLLALALIVPISFNALGHPWLIDGLKLPHKNVHSNWKTMDDDLKNKLLAGKVLTSRYYNFLYYVGERPDAFIRTTLDDTDYDLTEGGGIEQIKNTRELDQYLKTNQGPVFIIENRYSFKNKACYSEEMRTFVQQHMIPVRHNADQQILIFKKR